MKRITRSEAQAWIDPCGILIADNLRLKFDQQVNRPGFRARSRVSLSDIHLWRFAESVVEWLPNNGQRMVWFESWDTYPVGQLIFLERIRCGQNDSRRIIETPGNLFETTPNVEYDQRTQEDQEEDAVLIALVLFAICCQCDAVLLSNRCNDRVALFDGQIEFFSDNREHIALAPGVQIENIGINDIWA
jgi:hypothetical protein